MNRVVMVTGLQAAGKTTIGNLLAAALHPLSAHFDGDVFYRMVANGHSGMSVEPTEEALRQVRLRYEAAALVARHYADAGFDFVYSDIVLGRDVEKWLDSVGGERHLVVLVPSIDAIVARETARRKNSYRDWMTPGGTLADAVRSMSRLLDAVPRRGLWLDTTDDDPATTVARIVADDLVSSRW